MDDGELARLRVRRDELSRASFQRGAGREVFVELAAANERIDRVERQRPAPQPDRTRTASEIPDADADHDPWAPPGPLIRRSRRRPVAVLGVALILVASAGVWFATRADTVSEWTPTPAASDAPVESLVDRPDVSPDAAWTGWFDQPRQPADLPPISLDGTSIAPESVYRVGGSDDPATPGVARIFVARDTANRLCLLAASSESLQASCVSEEQFRLGGIRLVWTVDGVAREAYWDATGGITVG